MFRIVFWLLITLAAAAYATDPEIRITANFENPMFPPDGWIVEKKGTAGTAWGRIFFGGNHFARGFVFGPRTTSGMTSLTTNLFYLRSYTYPHVKFRVYSEQEGAGVYTLGVTLRLNGVVLHTFEYTCTSGWTYKYPLFPIIRVTSDQYRVGWFIYAEGGSSARFLATVNIDDVTVGQYNNGVAASSLGRVKTLYR